MVDSEFKDAQQILDIGASDGLKITFEDFYTIMTNQKLEKKEAIALLKS